MSPRHSCVSAAVFSFALLLGISTPVHAQIFATSVVGTTGSLGSNVWYNDPTAVLGQPTTLINGTLDIPKGTYHDSMVYPAYDQDPNGKNLIVTLGSSATITVKFDTPIVHSDTHWYGDDFIVFGNTFFPASGSVTPTSDMTKLKIGATGGIYQNGTPSISVSSDGLSFVTLAPVTPWYPTNPYFWAGVSTQNPSGWDDSRLQDFTKPISPTLTAAMLGGSTVANAANNLYDGSAGGAAFSLVGSGLSSIQYIRFTGTGNSSVIDAVSRVSDAAGTAPEPGALGLLMAALPIVAIGVRRRREQG